MCIFKFRVGSQIYPSFPLLVFLFLLSAYELLNWILIICPTGPSINVTSSITFLLISAFSSPQPHPQKVVIKFFDLCSVMVEKRYLPVVLICIYPIKSEAEDLCDVEEQFAVSFWKVLTSLACFPVGL